MFADAIENIGQFTCPILFITRGYKEENVIHSTGTLFFINDRGCAITCRHIAETLIIAEQINSKYKQFKEKRNEIYANGNSKEQLKQLEKQYNYKVGTTVNIKCQFVGGVAPIKEFVCHVHEKYDLAIIEFKNFDQKLYEGHSVFIKDSNEIRPGNMLCRLGFPFSEFDNFAYNKQLDDIEWVQEGNRNIPRFPIEGMITRFSIGSDRQLNGIELSTPRIKWSKWRPVI